MIYEMTYRCYNTQTKQSLYRKTAFLDWETATARLQGWNMSSFYHYTLIKLEQVPANTCQCQYPATLVVEAI